MICKNRQKLANGHRRYTMRDTLQSLAFLSAATASSSLTTIPSSTSSIPSNPFLRNPTNANGCFGLIPLPSPGFPSASIYDLCNVPGGPGSACSQSPGKTKVNMSVRPFTRFVEGRYVLTLPERPFEKCRTAASVGLRASSASTHACGGNRIVLCFNRHSVRACRGVIYCPGVISVRSSEKKAFTGLPILPTYFPLHQLSGAARTYRSHSVEVYANRSVCRSAWADS